MVKVTCPRCGIVHEISVHSEAFQHNNNLCATCRLDLAEIERQKKTKA